MRFLTLSGVVVCLAAAASAQVTLGISNQSITFTGIGANVSGQGQSTITWGSCVYTAPNTVCTVSGSYTGLGDGGTYSFVYSYPGNGPSKLTGIAQTPSSPNFYFGPLTAGATFTTTLTEANGTVVQFYDLSFAIYYLSNAVCMPTGTSCSPGQVGLTPGASITGPMNGTWTTAPVIRNTQGVISAGAYGGFSSIAPGTWIEIYGTNLATTLVQNWATANFNGNLAPTALGGTTVTVGGLPAYIDYVSPGQVNVQVPSGVPSGSQQVVVTTAGGSSSGYIVTVNPTQPGLLAPSSFLFNNSQYAVALFANTLTYVLPVTVSGVQTERAHVGDNIVLYGIGFGPVTPNIPAGQIVTQTNALSSFQVFFGGVPAVVTYAGLAPGYVGLYQFNVTVPNVAASDTIPVTFSLNGATGSQTLVVAVQN